MMAVLIPARSGSKRIPYKNTKLINGKPLIYYAITTALKVTDHVYVSTDSNFISSYSVMSGALVVRRPRELVTDEATTESAMEHFFELHPEYDSVLLFQCTSPLINEEDLHGMIDAYNANPEEGCVLLSRHLMGKVELVGNKVKVPPRKRSQEFEFEDYTYSEAGAWITPKKVLEKGLRTSDTNSYYIMKHDNVDIDVPEDLVYAEIRLR